MVAALTAVRLVVRPGLRALRRHGVNQRWIIMVGMSSELNDYIAAQAKK